MRALTLRTSRSLKATARAEGGHETYQRIGRDRVRKARAKGRTITYRGPNFSGGRQFPMGGERKDHQYHNPTTHRVDNQDGCGDKYEANANLGDPDDGLISHGLGLGCKMRDQI